MPIALVKVDKQIINDPTYGKIDFINEITVSTIDNQFKRKDCDFIFPSVRTPNNGDYVFDDDAILTRHSANKLMSVVSKKVYSELCKSSLIVVQSQKDKELVREFVSDITIIIIE